MLYAGTDPESYITEYTLVYDDNTEALMSLLVLAALSAAQLSQLCPSKTTGVPLS